MNQQQKISLFKKEVSDRDYKRLLKILKLRKKNIPLCSSEKELWWRYRRFRPTYRKKEPTSYKSYLRSDKWNRKREELFKKRGRVCEVCGSDHNIHVHHLTYKRIFRERLTDLKVLCGKCHKLEHGIS